MVRDQVGIRQWRQNILLALRTREQVLIMKWAEAGETIGNHQMLLMGTNRLGGNNRLQPKKSKETLIKTAAGTRDRAQTHKLGAGATRVQVGTKEQVQDLEAVPESNQVLLLEVNHLTGSNQVLQAGLNPLVGINLVRQNKELMKVQNRLIHGAKQQQQALGGKGSDGGSSKGG